MCPRAPRLHDYAGGHDEALNAAREVIDITQVRRGRLPTKGWRCGGKSREELDACDPLRLVSSIAIPGLSTSPGHTSTAAAVDRRNLTTRQVTVNT